MRMNKLVCVVLLAAACGKKAEEKKVDPGPTPKVVDKQPTKETPLARVPVTSKSAEAIAQLEKARFLALNARGGEAIELYKKVIELDPELAIAYAELGGLLPGSEATDMLAKAGPLAAKASEGEQKLVEANQAFRAGDFPKAKAALDKVAEIAPGQWEVHLQLANIENGRGDAAAAIKHAEMAVAAKPDLATAHNVLAYAYAGQGEWDKAIAAGKKQVELMPKEPNPLDTLGEVQLMAGKFEDSEKSFEAAATLDPKFSIAWNGVALTRAFRGDWKGAIEANEKRSASLLPDEKFELMTAKAWFLVGDNKMNDALAQLAVIDKDPEAKKFPIYAFASMMRGNLQVMSGKYPEAQKSFAEAVKRSETLAGDARKQVKLGFALGMLRGAALAGKPAAEADKHVADVEAIDKEAPDKFSTGLVAYAKGLQIWAKSGPKDAIAELAKCDPQQILCRFDLATAQRKAGDATGAEATEKSIRENPVRDASVAAFWTKLPKAGDAAKPADAAKPEKPAEKVTK